jgi:hypothetical protein
MSTASGSSGGPHSLIKATYEGLRRDGIVFRDAGGILHYTNSYTSYSYEQCLQLHYVHCTCRSKQQHICVPHRKLLLGYHCYHIAVL